MTLNPVIARLNDTQVLGLTIFGEARSEGPEGRIAVANVIRNRVFARIGGDEARTVCLAPFQFSCWLAIGGDANHSLLLDTARHLLGVDPTIGPMLRECLWIADGLQRAQFVDNTRGATHYLTTGLLASHPPAWAVDQRVLVTIGHHAFLRVP